MKFIKLFFALTLIGFILSSNTSYAEMDDAKRLGGIALALHNQRNRLQSVSSALAGRGDRDESIKTIVDIEVSNADAFIDTINGIVELRSLSHKMESEHDKSLVMERTSWRIDTVKRDCKLANTRKYGNPNDNLTENLKKFNARQIQALSELHFNEEVYLRACTDVLNIFSKF